MRESAPALAAPRLPARALARLRQIVALVDGKTLDNPLLKIELRRRMRGPRPFLAVTVYLLLMLLPLFTVGGLDGTTMVGGAEIGKGGQLCLVIFGCQCTAICLFAPALTASALPREHARGTFDDLRLSLLSPGEIIIGKFLPAMAVVVLLLVLALPYYTLGFLLGGVAPMLIIHDMLSLTLLAGALAAFALLAGALTEKTASAIALTYLLLLMFFSQFGCFYLFISQGLARGLHPLPGMLFDIIALVPIIVFLLALARGRICEGRSAGIYVAYAALFMVGIWVLVFMLIIAGAVAVVAVQALRPALFVGLSSYPLNL